MSSATPAKSALRKRASAGGRTPRPEPEPAASAGSRRANEAQSPSSDGAAAASPTRRRPLLLGLSRRWLRWTTIWLATCAALLVYLFW